MRPWLAALLLLMPSLARPVIIDRIVVVVGNSIVKQSDINRDLSVTEFLNGDRLDLSLKQQRIAASRLIDQIFIRKEIELGDYAVATPEQVEHQLDEIIKTRFKSEAALQDSLRAYGVTVPDLKSHFLWQLTVLRFIDARFKPAVLVTDAEIEDYYKAHSAELRREHPGKSSLNDVTGEISDILVGERVNKLFFAWLDEQRNQTKIKYLQAGLQ